MRRACYNGAVVFVSGKIDAPVPCSSKQISNMSKINHGIALYFPGPFAGVPVRMESDGTD